MPFRSLASLAFTLALGCAASANAQSDQAVQKAAKVLAEATKAESYFRAMDKAQAIKLFQPVLKESSPRTTGRFVAAFVLACKGVDLKNNVQKVLQPSVDWKSGFNPEEVLKPSNGMAEHDLVMEDVPEALYLIYRIQHYQPALHDL